MKKVSRVPASKRMQQSAEQPSTQNVDAACQANDYLSFVYHNVKPDLDRCAQARLSGSLENQIEDLVQDVFLIFAREALSQRLKCLQGRKLCDLQSHDFGQYLQGCRKYLFAVLCNRCKDLYRQSYRQSPRFSLHGDSFESAEINDLGKLVAQEQGVMLRKAVADLPRLLRQVTLRYYFEGLSIRDIARELELPAGTVKRRLFNARQRLAQSLLPHVEPQVSKH